MIEETYSAAFLGPRTLPIQGGLVARHHGWIVVKATELMKSVVRTPMSGGKVDYDAVPSGSSIWVTVKDESSPMHGRPILITKRPDGHFALEGGSGVSHWHDDPEREKKIAARRHLVMKTPSPQQAQADKAKKPGDEAAAAAKQEERATARKVRQSAAADTRKAVGIPDDPRLDRKARDTIADTARGRLQAHGLGPDEAAAAAKHVPGAVQEARNRVFAHAVAQRVDAAHNPSGGRLARTDDHQPAPDQVTPGHTARGDDLPSHEATGVAVSHAAVAEAVKRAKLAKGGDLSQPEMEGAVKEAIHAQVDRQLEPPAPGDEEQSKGSLGVYGDFEYFSQDGQIYRAPTANPIDANGYRSGGRWEGSEKHRQQVLASAERAFGPAKDAATPQGPDGDLPIADIPAWKPDSPEEAKAAVDAFGREAQARGFQTGDVTPDEVANDGQQAVPAKAIDRSLVDAEGLSDTAYDKLMDQYRQASKAPVAGAFYRALGEHWASPEDYAASLAGHVATGAATAIQNTIGQQDIDVADLVGRIGVDAAAHVLAAHTIASRGLDGDGVDATLKTLNQTGGSGIRAIEQDALNRHADLQKEAGKLTASLDGLTGDGAGTAARRSELQLALARNINHQRATLGGALGKMQMQATYTHALGRFAQAAKAGTGSVGVPVALTFGDDERAADEAAVAMRLPQGAYQKLHDTRHGWTLQVDGTRLQSAAEGAAARGKDLHAARATQQDESPAADYRVPGQATQVPDGQGGHADVAWTPMQRNDVEFLHKQAGGVLMGSREGGKRLAALGWAMKQAEDNPQARTLVTTDEGGARQWPGLAAQRFPSARTFTVPPHADAKEVTKALRDFAGSRGGILVVPHTLLSGRHHNQIARMADAGQLHGHIVENPPSGGTGTGHTLANEAHELLTATANSSVRRVALHDRHPIEAPELAAQLAHWAHPDKVGAADLRKAREVAGNIGGLNPATASAIQQQVVNGLASSVVAAPFAMPGQGQPPPEQVRQQVARQERQAAHPPKGETPERVEWRGELERAIGEGNDGEAQAIVGMAGHYGWEPSEARALYQQLTGEGDTDSHADTMERETIENSPYFGVFHHFNADSRLKKINPYTGKRLLGRDKKSGKLGQSTEEPWEMQGSGYDQVASEALSQFEGGHSQRYGMDAGDFWREATKAHRRYTELSRRAAPDATLAAQDARAVGGGAAQRKRIAGIFARKADKAVDAPAPADRSASDRKLIDAGSHLATRPLSEHVAEAKARLARTRKDVAAERKQVGAAAVRGGGVSNKGAELGRKAMVESAQKELDRLPDDHRRHVERAIKDGLFDHLPEGVQKEYAHRREALEAQGEQSRRSFGEDRPTGPANTPVGELPQTPAVGAGSYTPIVAQPEDLAGGNVSKGNRSRPAKPAAANNFLGLGGRASTNAPIAPAKSDDEIRAAIAAGKPNTPVGMLGGMPGMAFGGAQHTSIAAAPTGSPATPEVPFKLQMQYGGLSEAQASRVKQQDAGQQSLMGAGDVVGQRQPGRKGADPAKEAAERARLAAFTGPAEQPPADRRKQLEQDVADLKRNEPNRRDFQADLSNPGVVSQDYKDAAKAHAGKVADAEKAVRLHDIGGYIRDAKGDPDKIAELRDDAEKYYGVSKEEFDRLLPGASDLDREGRDIDTKAHTMSQDDYVKARVQRDKETGVNPGDRAEQEDWNLPPGQAQENYYRKRHELLTRAAKHLRKSRPLILWRRRG